VIASREVILTLTQLNHQKLWLTHKRERSNQSHKEKRPRISLQLRETQKHLLRMSDQRNYSNNNF
jgi:hypothetical protein